VFYKPVSWIYITSWFGMTEVCCVIGQNLYLLTNVLFPSIGCIYSDDEM
jgi:hypothetical protein